MAQFTIFDGENGLHVSFPAGGGMMTVTPTAEQADRLRDAFEAIVCGANIQNAKYNDKPSDGPNLIA